MPAELRVVPFVLMYHSVAAPADDPARITVSPKRFAHQLAWLKRAGVRGVSMRELLAAAERGSTAGLVGLTFDDGYADFASHAAPILARYGFTATAFVVADRLGGHNEWDGEPRKALMTADEVRAVAQMGVEVGSHGLRHQALSGADADTVAVDLRRSRDILESVLEAPVRGFAYPYGAVPESAAAAGHASGYDYAVATWQQAARHRFALPRTYIGERDGGTRLLAKRVRHRVAWGSP